MTPEQEKELLELTKRHLRLQKLILAALVVIGVSVVPFAAVLSFTFLMNALGVQNTGFF